MATVSTTITAWLTNHGMASPGEILKGKGIEYLGFSKNDMRHAGWTKVGEATITVELNDEREMVSNKIDSLREEAKAVRAEATAKVTRIESQINDLLAISFDGRVSE